MRVFRADKWNATGTATVGGVREYSGLFVAMGTTFVESGRTTLFVLIRDPFFGS